MVTLEQHNTTLLVTVPYEGTENYKAGAHVYEWVRKPTTQKKPGFVVYVFVEGYRLNKDVWLHDSYHFVTLQEALDFYYKLIHATGDEVAKMLNFEGTCKDNGWYGLTFEYANVYEYTSEGGKYEWERK